MSEESMNLRTDQEKLSRWKNRREKNRTSMIPSSNLTGEQMDPQEEKRE